ncbi:hypothetical protein ANN_10708 [Periplaneta americana]|uniref:Uncharacterized protein n=1 Tax=Periplaneta americana TaxID=6978 RepID=A0ABQ8T304_PERAM|nr:hypothetical protein ANN_10708 [Periplaneta americana]
MTRPFTLQTRSYGIKLQLRPHGLIFAHQIAPQATETYSRALIDQFLSDAFTIHCWLKQDDALSPLRFDFALEYAIRKVQKNNGGLKWDRLHQLNVYADDANMSGEYLETIREITGILLEASKEFHFTRIFSYFSVSLIILLREAGIKRHRGAEMG